MNRRNRASGKKIEFEPKIPQVAPEAAVVEDKIIEYSKDETELVQQMKGMFAPKTFEKPSDFDFEKDSFIFNLPDSFQNCNLIVFDDNTLGIRMDGIIYECDASYIGDGMVVEIGENVKKVGESKFIITGYNYEKTF